MPSGEHSHWVRYIHRIVKRTVGDSKAQIEAEFLQLICIDDGEIFHEVRIGVSV